METLQIAYLVLLIGAGAALTSRYWMRWYSTRLNATAKAAEVTGEVYPVWAAQGPFDSGAQSAAAMRYAYVAVRGPTDAENMSEAIAQHAHAFDSDTGTWESLRQYWLTHSGQKTQDHVTIAKALAAAESLNKDLFEAGGYKIEFASQPDGRASFAYKRIWSAEEVKEQEVSRAEIIYKSAGTSLLEDSSAEGHHLLQFLIGIQSSSAEHDPATPMALGKLWLAFISLARENPDSEIAKQFKALNDACSTTKPKLGN